MTYYESKEELEQLEEYNNIPIGLDGMAGLNLDTTAVVINSENEAGDKSVLLKDADIGKMKVDILRKELKFNKMKLLTTQIVALHSMRLLLILLRMIFKRILML